MRSVMLNSDKVGVWKTYQVRGEHENMKVLSPFSHKLLFSEKHGYKNVFQDESLAQHDPILHHTF